MNTSSILARAWPIALFSSLYACTITDADSDPLDQPPHTLDAIELPGEQLFPEGVAIDDEANVFVGSLTTGEVLRLRAGETEVETLVAGGELDTRTIASAVGLYADRELELLWVCDGGGFLSGDPRPSALVAIDRESGELRARHELPGAGGLCNDITQDEAGNLYVSDSFQPNLLRLPAAQRESTDALAIWASESDWAVEPGQFGLNGLDLGGASLWVSHTQQGAVYRMSLGDSPGAIVELELDRTPNGIDGLKVEPDGNLLFVEGYAEQLTRIELEGDAGTLRVVELGKLDGPTTFALLEGSAWIVEGQLPHLLDPSAGPPNLPFRVVRRELASAPPS